MSICAVNETTNSSTVATRWSLPAPDAAQDEGPSDRLRRTTSDEVMSVDLVSALAGDRTMSDDERRLVAQHEVDRGETFFSDLLYAISHHYFAPPVARSLWRKILEHKHSISTRLGRNVRITVATLDYLSNITDDLRAPTLIPEAYVSELANLSMRDAMTGLFNHSTCFELLALELRGYHRYGGRVGLLLLDIDDFKQINDHDGHPAGDQVLIELAEALTSAARRSDVCCRLGGDEFAVILRLTEDARQAREVAERIRACAASIRWRGRPITVSLGVALCDDTVSTVDELVGRADQALYTAKLAGKNRVVLHG